MTRIKCNVWLEPATITMLDRAVDNAKKCSMHNANRSRVVEEAVWRALEDPVIRLKERKKELLREIAKIDDQVEVIEASREDQR